MSSSYLRHQIFGRSRVILVLTCGWFALAPHALRAQAPAEGYLTNRLRLDEIIRRVISYNESVQVKMLDFEISQKTYQGEKGIFEPQVVSSIDHVDSQRPNNTQQRLSLSFLSSTPQLNERNTIYNGGVEFLTPTGAKIHTGIVLRDLRNNLQISGLEEYETFVGANITQPLLKNFGPNATLARIRLAAIANDIAFQEYRRQMMLILSQAEASYWDLYLTLEQVRVSQESVALAERIFKDNRSRAEVGRSSELEVLQAEAGLALRKSRQMEARYKVYESANRLASLYSDQLIVTNTDAILLDPPVIRPVAVAFYADYQQAFMTNPDYLIRQKQVDQENLRIKYTRNQRLPQVDLKASYGLNGLGTSPGDSWDDIDSHEFPAWSLGVEMRIPMLGGKREKNDYEAAKLSKKRALFNLKEAEIQIGNSLNSAIHKVQTYRENVQNYQSVVEFHEKLLQSQLARLEVGSIDSRTVLETEEKLFEAK
ncbi:MAG: TolC family protein, partial [Verrucomicrobiota bacterium]